VILIGLDDGAALIDVLPNEGVAMRVHHNARGGKSQELRLSGGNLQPFASSRAKKGKVIDAKLKVAGLSAVVIPTAVV
jgi:topoisomerase-4 subunit A